MSTRRLDILGGTRSHTFLVPSKRINEGHDVPFFLASRAYRDIGTFMMQLNVAMCPRKSPTGSIQQWQLDDTLELSNPVQKLQDLLQKLDSFIEEAPPDTGPRRFGNVSFRKWHEILESRVKDLLQSFLPREVLDFSVSSSGEASVLDELTPYLMGAFGSSQRLDYGTGHELSFLAFLACIWKLGGFTVNPPSDGSLERSIVMGVVEPYLRVVRRLILTYTLEPAGSHGVWGLDDHFFIPYIFGSSQYCPAINNDDPIPVEGALAGSPNPADIAKKNIVDRERKHNLYFAAVGFINDVKTGPFWEHSPILFDISGVRSGWGKINKGMIKMYNAEVLSKFPVIQHFPFGSLFAWEQDPEAMFPASSVHTSSQPTSISTGRPSQGTQVPWASPIVRGVEGATKAPWARSNTTSQSALPPTMAPWVANAAAHNSRLGPPSFLENNEAPTRAPLAKR